MLSSLCRDRHEREDRAGDKRGVGVHCPVADGSFRSLGLRAPHAPPRPGGSTAERLKLTASGYQGSIMAANTSGLALCSPAGTSILTRTAQFLAAAGNLHGDRTVEFHADCGTTDQGQSCPSPRPCGSGTQTPSAPSLPKPCGPCAAVPTGRGPRRRCDLVDRQRLDLVQRHRRVVILHVLLGMAKVVLPRRVGEEH